MRIILYILFFMFIGCAVDAEEEPVPCGYDDLPYEHEPISCGVNPWTYEGDCCTWITKEHYSECVISWCYNENVCGWSINQRSCHPI
jgi:hypothetical protein